MHTRRLSWFAALIIGLGFSVDAQAIDAGTGTQQPNYNYRFEESSSTTFRLSEMKAGASAAKAFIEMANDFGIKRSIEKWMGESEPFIKSQLGQTGLPGVLIAVEMERSATEVSIKKIVGGSPSFVGSGLSQVEVWTAYSAGPTLKAGIDDGFIPAPDASFFMWARLKDERVEYGFSIPQYVIKDEAIRYFSDAEVRKQFDNRYRQKLMGFVVERLEKHGRTKEIREQAAALRASRQEALKERNRVDLELKEALAKAAKAQQVAAVFDTLSKVLTLSQLAMELTSEFPEDKAAIEGAHSKTELQTVFDDIMTNAAKNQDAVSASLQTIESKELNLRLQTLKIMRLDNIEPTSIPGL